MADPEANSEQLETAYGKLIAIYAAREDYKTIMIFCKAAVM